MTSPNPFNSLQRNRRGSKWFSSLLWLALVVVLTVVVLLWQTQLSSVLWCIGAPLLHARNALSNSEVTQLQAELASTTAALADRNALATQNTELKKMLGRPQTSTTVLGAVLQRPPGLPYDTLMIDVGTNDGVAVGDLVLGGGTAAIGDVTEVYANTSRVSLFSAPGRTYDAQVEPKALLGSVIPLSLAGQGVGSFSGEVPASSVAAVGDPVVLPGLGNETLGNIVHIDLPSGSSFETLYVQLPVSIFSLQYVQIQTHI